MPAPLLEASMKVLLSQSRRACALAAAPPPLPFSNDCWRWRGLAGEWEASEAVARLRLCARDGDCLAEGGEGV